MLANGQQTRGIKIRSGKAAAAVPRVWLLDPFCFTPWYTASLACSLKAAGAEVRLIAGILNREPTYFEELALRSDPGPFRFSAMWKSKSASINRTLRLAEIILNIQVLSRSLRPNGGQSPAILHFQQMPMLNHQIRPEFGLIQAAQRRGTRVLHTVHNLLPHDTGDRLRPIYAELYRRVDHLVCHSASVKQRLREEFGIPEHRVTVIPHGPLFALEEPPTEAQTRAARIRLGLPHDQAIMLWQGVLATYKGVDVLVCAWKRIVQSLKGKTSSLPLLVIAGSGPIKFEDEVRRAVAKAGGSIRADLAYIPANRLPDYYMAADILVYPYRSITTSGALLTGLSYGRPIVASRLPPFEEYLIDGDNACLVTPGDPTALADALKPLILDLNLRKGFGAVRSMGSTGSWERLVEGASKNRSRYVGWTEIGRRTCDLYRELATCGHHD